MLYVLIIRFHARIHGRFWNQKLQKRKLYVLNCVCVCVLYSIQLLYLKKNKNEAPSLVTTLGPAAEYEPKCVQFGSISLVSLIGDRWMLFVHKLLHMDPSSNPRSINWVVICFSPGIRSNRTELTGSSVFAINLVTTKSEQILDSVNSVWFRL